MNMNEVFEMVGGNGYVTLGQIVNNLRVLQVKKREDSICYFLTRENKDMPWPAPHQAGTKIDRKPYYCCSYSTLEDDEWPEDTKQLNVYHVFVDD